MSVRPCQKLVYDRKSDNILRPLARSKKSPEEILDMDGASESWKAIVSKRENELVSAEVAAKGLLEKEEEAEPTSLGNLRKAPTSFAENSEGYWLALANASVRRIVTIVAAPETQSAVQRMVEQSPLKDLELNEGEGKKLRSSYFYYY